MANIYKSRYNPFSRKFDTIIDQVDGINVIAVGNNGYVQYNNGGSLGGAPKLYYDDINGYVGIGTVTPSYLLDVGGDIRGNAFYIGDGTTIADKLIYVNNGGTSLPALRYNETTGVWQYTNDGTTWQNIGSGSGTGVQIQDTDEDTLITTEETTDADTLVGKVAATECFRFHSDGIMDLPLQSGCRIYLSTAQTINDSVWTKVLWDTVDYDIQGEADVITNNRVTFKADGIYLIDCKVVYPPASQAVFFNGGYGFGIRIMHTSGLTTTEIDRYFITQVENNNNVFIHLMTTVQASANDYIEVETYHNSGTAVNLITGMNYTRLIVFKWS